MKTQKMTHQRFAWAVMILTGLALLTTTLPASAQCRGGQGQGQGDAEFRMGPRLAGLDLTDEQQKEVDGILDARREANLKLRAEQTRLRAEMHAEMVKEVPNENHLYDLVGKMTKIRGEIQKSRIDQHLAIGKVLTAEQRAKMTMMAGRGHRGMDGPRMGQGRGHGCGMGCDGPKKGGQARGCGSNCGSRKAGCGMRNR